MDRQQAEADRKAKALADAKKAAKAPDKTKLKAFAKTIRALQIPNMATPESQALATKIYHQAEKFAVWIEAEAEKL